MQQAYIVRQTAITNAGTAVNVYAPRLRPGQRALVTHLALMNRSGETVTVQFGVTDQVGFQQIWAQQSVSNSDGVGVLLSFLLYENDVLTAVVTGTADKGTVTLIASGEIHNPDPPAPPAAPPAPGY
jgi:hypothetical protein